MDWFVLWFLALIWFTNFDFALELGCLKTGRQDHFPERCFDIMVPRVSIRSVAWFYNKSIFYFWLLIAQGHQIRKELFRLELKYRFGNVLPVHLALSLVQVEKILIFHLLLTLCLLDQLHRLLSQKCLFNVPRESQLTLGFDWFLEIMLQSACE